MCGRYVIEDYQELSERLTNVPIRYDFELRPNWNAAPTQTLPVVIEDDGEWVVQGMHWGMIPKWTKPGQRPKVMPINARSETAADKPMFKSSMKHRRCIVPANGFYEWQKQGSGSKQPWLIQPEGHQLMLFAGLWDEALAGPEGETIRSFAILTTDANTPMSKLHDRMPVILDDDEIPDWLDAEESATEPLQHLLDPAADDAVSAYPVSKNVNGPKNNNRQLLERVEV